MGLHVLRPAHACGTVRLPWCGPEGRCRARRTARSLQTGSRGTWKRSRPCWPCSTPLTRDRRWPQSGSSESLRPCAARRALRRRRVGHGVSAPSTSERAQAAAAAPAVAVQPGHVGRSRLPIVIRDALDNPGEICQGAAISCGPSGAVRALRLTTAEDRARWRERERVRAILLPCARSMGTLRSGLRCWEAFCQKASADCTTRFPRTRVGCRAGSWPCHDPAPALHR